MNKNYLVLGAIGLGFLFLLKPKFKTVFAETSIPNIHEPIPLQTQILSTNISNDMPTFADNSVITVLD